MTTREKAEAVLNGLETMDGYDKGSTAPWTQEVLRAYLAEHPADEETLIDEAWLRSLGFKDRRVRGFDGFSVIYCQGWLNVREDFVHQCWESSLDDGRHPEGNFAWLPNFTTRGAVRRLLAALGIPIPTE